MQISKEVLERIDEYIKHIFECYGVTKTREQMLDYLLDIADGDFYVHDSFIKE